MELFAKFNRLRDDDAKSDGIFVYEFSEPLEFYIITDEEPVVKASIDGNVIEFTDDITPPQAFYINVLNKIKTLYSSNKLSSVKGYNKADFEEYFSKEVLKYE